MSTTILHQLERPLTLATNDGIRQGMSVAFIDCDGFRKLWETELPPCCDKCHESVERSDGSKVYPNKIYVRPRKENGDYNSDWALCIEGVVCCKVFHLVTDIPNSWWRAQAERLGVRRDDGQGYRDSSGRPWGEVVSIRRPIAITAVQRARILADEQKRAESKGIDDFLDRRPRR